MEAKLISIIKELVDKDDFIGDDCAVVELGNEKYLFSVDNFIEDTHFSLDYYTPYDVGWKALAISISDVCAMAGIPLMALVGLNLRKDLPNKENFVREFYSGMQDCADKFASVKIIGGDLCKSETEISVSVTIIGKAHAKGVMKRSGAQAGDKICVTGSFGESGKFLQDTKKTPAIKVLRPEPRLRAALGIWDSSSRGALMDTSDGLAQALLELAAKNQAEFVIDTEAIPHDKNIDLSLALYGGEDYELLGCFSEVPEGFTLIGEVKSTGIEPKVFLNPGSQTLASDKIFAHF